MHQLHWQTRVQQLDAELDRAADQVLTQLRRLLPRPPRRAGRPDETKPETEPETRPDGLATAKTAAPDAETNPERTDRNQRPLWPPRDRGPRDLGPPPVEFEQLFQGDEDSGLYFVIWNEKGEILQKSDSAPEIKFPNIAVDPGHLTKRIHRDRVGDRAYREVILPFGFTTRNLLVGRSIERDILAYRQSGLILVGTGFVILAAGLIGGGWLTAQALRPITDMTKAAEAISAMNLSKRIGVNDTDTELGQLAVVLNQTFDRLQSAFERQSQFTADASHELRTPLSVISAHTELALSRQRSPDEYRLALETCQQAAQRMRSLIDVLLQLARFDSGASSLYQNDLDLEPLINDCIDLVASLAEKRGIRIEAQLSSCHVLGDSNRLAQVVTNLLTNAIRYNVDGGCVRVGARIENGMAVISVADTGIGIAKTDLPRIFDRFYQVDKVRSRSEGSSGLGLSICKTIVEAHGGVISVTSELNVGTTVEVRLPQAASQQAPRKAVLAETNLAPALGES